MSGPQAAYLPGDRLHLHHGPIDLIVSAKGPEREAALAAAVARFDGLLEGLAGKSWMSCATQFPQPCRPVETSGQPPPRPPAGRTIPSPN